MRCRCSCITPLPPAACHMQCAAASCAVNFDVIQSSGRKLFTFMARLKVIQTANEMKKLHTQDEFKKSTQQSTNTHTPMYIYKLSAEHAYSCSLSSARALLNWEFKLKSVRSFSFQCAWSLKLEYLMWYFLCFRKYLHLSQRRIKFSVF